MTRSRRPTTALEPAEVPVEPQTGPEITLSPEEQIKLDTLAGIPEELVSDELRGVVLKGAHIEANRREFEALATQAESEVQAAIAKDDIDAAQIAAARLVTLERIRPMLPVPTVQESLLTEAFRKATDMLAGAVGTLPQRPP